jgi:hypothetical protein
VTAEAIGLLSDRYGLDHAVYLAPAAYLGATFFWGALALWQRCSYAPAEVPISAQIAAVAA